MQWVAAAMAVISAVGSIVGGIKGGKSAGAAGRAEARAEGDITSAKLEDLFAEERNMRGQTLAGAAGANVKVDKGSPVEILAEQARTFERERQITAKVGASRASITKQRGEMLGKQIAYQGISTGIGQLAGAFSMMPKYLGKQKGPG